MEESGDLSVLQKPCNQPPTNSELFGHNCSANMHMHAELLLLFLGCSSLRAASDKSTRAGGQSPRAKEGPRDLGASRGKGHQQRGKTGGRMSKHKPKESLWLGFPAWRLSTQKDFK